MNSKRRAKVAFVSVVFLFLISIANPLGHAQGMLGGSNLTSSQQSSLLFTVNPDKSVGVSMNSSSSLPVSGVTGLLTSGYKVHSSSNFTQLANAVVENSTIRYQLPAVLSTYVSSITLSGSQTGLTGSGSLAISTTLPLQSLSLVYSTTPNLISVNATAQLQLGCGVLCTAFGLTANQTTFSQAWTRTFGNSTWISYTQSQIQNATMHALTVTVFSGTVNSSTATSASVTIRFAAVPTAPSTDFIKAFENNTLSPIFPMGIPSGLDAIIQSAIALQTGEYATLSYIPSTGLLVIKANAAFVGNLDAQLNNLKAQFFRLFMPLQPASTITPSEIFLNATTVTVSKIHTTSDLDLSSGTSSSTFSGLILNPPTEGSSSNFTIHGLFQTLGATSLTPTGSNITLAGGSDSTYQVKVVVPSGTPPPSSTTSNSATWLNVRNASSLQNVEFQLEKLPLSIFAFLTSPIGIAIDAIVAAAIIGTILVLVRRRRSKMPTPLTPSGPTSTPGMGPGPAPPTP